MRELTVGSPLPWVVALQLSDSQVEVDESVTYSGSVKSATGSPGSGKVTVQKRRASGGEWIDWRSATLKSDGSYAVAVTMTNRQSWQFRTKMAADSANLTGYSARARAHGRQPAALGGRPAALRLPGRGRRERHLQRQRAAAPPAVPAAAR